jgi:hypothetical protein
MLSPLYGRATTVYYNWCIAFRSIRISFHQNILAEDLGPQDDYNILKRQHLVADEP